MKNENNNISQFDELFREGLEQHSIQAPKGVFEAVSQATTAGVQVGAKAVITKWIIGGMVAVGMGTAAYVVLSDGQESQPKDTITEKVVPVKEEAALETQVVQSEHTPKEVEYTASLPLNTTRDKEKRTSAPENKTKEVRNTKLADPGSTAITVSEPETKTGRHQAPLAQPKKGIPVLMVAARYH